ncbi:MAG: RagB/SusD family nutrient uptake outer membrane protein [Agriterribacter sp.]
MIKKYFSILLSTVILTFFFSCKKALETKGHSFLSPNTFYANEADANAALNGAYANLYSQNMYGRAAWLVSDMPADLFYPVINNADRNSIYQGTFTASNGIILVWWVNNYLVIKNANDVIAYVPAIAMDEHKKNNIVGNARFLRGLCYFNLVEGYGDVPLLLTPGIDSLFPTRSSTSAVYVQIIEDLKYAEANCLHIDELPEQEIGRATSEAASGLLAKVYLQKSSTGTAESSDHSNAMALCNKVISYSNSHPDYLALEETFGNIFNPDTKNGKEILFNVQFGAPPNASNIINMGFQPIAKGGFGSYNGLDYHYNSYKPDDIIRRTVNIGNIEGSARKISKYDDDGVPPGVFGRNNWIVLRYADILLMQSEAQHGVDPSGTAKFAGINAVRSRAGIGALDFTNTPTSDDFITALVNERCWEFCIEGHRRWDLLRLNRYKEVLQAVGRPFDELHMKYYPIPQTEIDVNPNLVQTQGF